LLQRGFAAAIVRFERQLQPQHTLTEIHNDSGVREVVGFKLLLGEGAVVHLQVTRQGSGQRVEKVVVSVGILIIKLELLELVVGFSASIHADYLQVLVERSRVDLERVRAHDHSLPTIIDATDRIIDKLGLIHEQEVGECGDSGGADLGQIPFELLFENQIYVFVNLRQVCELDTQIVYQC
jgi:hypothetical protein